MGRVSTCQKNCNTIDLRRAQVNYSVVHIVTTRENTELEIAHAMQTHSIDVALGYRSTSAIQYTGVKQCTFHWLVSSELVQK